MDYHYAWKVRKIQLIIINAIFFIGGVATAISDKDFTEIFTIWIPWAWIVGALVANFTKNGDKMSTLVRDFFSGWFIGSFASAFGEGGMFVAFAFCFFMIKSIIGIVVLIFLIIFELVLYPITSIYYFIQSRK